MTDIIQPIVPSVTYQKVWRCPKCLLDKILLEFYINSEGLRRSICKKCYCLISGKYNSAHKEHRRKYLVNWRKLRKRKEVV